MTSPAQELLAQLDALRKAANAKVAEREGQPQQLDIFTEEDR